MLGGKKRTISEPAKGTGFQFNLPSTVSSFGHQMSAFKHPAFQNINTEPTGFGGFAQPQQSMPFFGAAPQPVASTTSFFGQSNTSAFDVAPSGFGFGQTAYLPNTSLFKPTTTATGTGFGGFGQTSPAGFGSFGQTSPAPSKMSGIAGAAIVTTIAKYQPTIGTDTIIQRGEVINVSAKHHCITAMKEYETKCLEELRMEYYLNNRKGPTHTTAPASLLFGSNTKKSPRFGCNSYEPDRTFKFDTKTTQTQTQSPIDKQKKPTLTKDDSNSNTEQEDPQHTQSNASSSKSAKQLTSASQSSAQFSNFSLNATGGVFLIYNNNICIQNPQP